MAIAVAVTTLGIYLTVRAQLYDQLDSDLLARARAQCSALRPTPTQIVVLPADALGDARIGLVTADRTAYPTQGGEAPPARRPGVRGRRGRGAGVGADASPRTARTTGSSPIPAGPGVALVFAASTESVDDTLAYIGFVSLVVGLLGVAAAATAGYGVARAGLAPLRSLTAATERVATTMDLTPIESVRNDEIGRLASSFNTMLALIGGSARA